MNHAQKLLEILGSQKRNVLTEQTIRVRRKDFEDKGIRKFISRTLLPQGITISLIEEFEKD